MYNDIRPYRDDEVAEVISRLVNDKEFQASIAAYVLPLMYKILPGFTRWIIKLSVTRRARSFTTIDDLQQEAAKYLYRLIKRSTSGFSYSGIENLDRTKPMLFISNHRDITLDPALVNLALHESGFTTLEIAIGDNLLTKPWVSDLMRLNKSFIVKRSEKTKRAMLKASKELSAYVHHTLNDNKQNVWIAQREGRAKDGLDKTNSALISMLLLNKEKSMSIKDYLKELNIVPVSISYQYDPCDKDKARELAQIEQTGQYQKAEHEDIESITQGILGKKGQIHLSFGEVVSGDFEDSKAIAAHLDNYIINNYKLYDSNTSAHQALNENGAAVPQLQQRLEGLSEAEQKWLLTMYANPVNAKQEINQ